MAQLTITFPDLDEGPFSVWVKSLEAQVERINSSVCCNDSSLVRINRFDCVLQMPGGLKYREDTADRTDLSPSEIAAFVRNYLNAGFDIPISIK